MKRFTWTIQMGDGEEFTEDIDEIKHSRDENDRNSSEDDALEYEEVSLSDMLLNIHAVYLMSRCVKNNDYLPFIQEKEISVHLDAAQEFLAINKIMLDEIAEVSSKELKDEKECRQVYDFIQMCRDNWHETDEVFYNSIIQSESYQYFLQSENHNYLSYIDSIMSFHHINPKRKPYYYFNLMALEVNYEVVEERYKLVRILSFVNHYYPTETDALTCQMVIQPQLFEDHLDMLEDEIINNCNDNISEYLSAYSVDDKGFIDSINKMIDCINSCKSGFSKYQRSIRPHRQNDGAKCFGLMDLDNSRYVSLCGPFDAKDSKILKHLKFSDKLKTRYANLKSSLHKYILLHPEFNGSIYSEMNLNMKSYPRTGYIKTIQTLDKAIDKGVDSKTIQSEYSCCERKMFSKICTPVKGNCYLFTSLETCKKCRPAVKELIATYMGLSLRVFYLKNGIITEADVSKF